MSQSKPPMSDDLGSLLDNYEGDKVKPQSKEEKAEDEWVARFNEARAKILRPTMEALGKEIERRGHDFLIVEKEFRRGNRAVPDQASIRIDLYLADEKTRTKINADRRPHLAFTTMSQKKLVQVTICDITSRGGVESTVGAFLVEEVDAKMVKDKFVALFKRLVSTR